MSLAPASAAAAPAGAAAAPARVVGALGVVVVVIADGARGEEG